MTKMARPRTGAAETGLSKSRFPQTSPFTVEQALDPEFLPD
jgi:hypothetical protein